MNEHTQIGLIVFGQGGVRRLWRGSNHYNFFFQSNYEERMIYHSFTFSVIGFDERE